MTRLSLLSFRLTFDTTFCTILHERLREDTAYKVNAIEAGPYLRIIGWVLLDRMIMAFHKTDGLG